MKITKEELDQYEKEMKEWQERYAKKPPNISQGEWDFQRGMMQPNKPGYYRANND